jgi:hypothetical protein
MDAQAGHFQCSVRLLNPAAGDSGGYLLHFNFVNLSLIP